MEIRGRVSEMAFHSLSGAQDMRVNEDMVDGAAVLRVRGTPLGKPDTDPLHLCVCRLAGQGTWWVVADLSEVRWLGAAMLGTLISSQLALKEGGGELCLAGITEKGKVALEVTGLSGVFWAAPTAKDGLAVLRARWESRDTDLTEERESERSPAPQPEPVLDGGIRGLAVV
jgi:hypothetical protein